jgi:hypothetical protein
MDAGELFVLIRRLFADRYSAFDMGCLVCVTERVMQRPTVPVKLSCPGCGPRLDIGKMARLRPFVPTVFTGSGSKNE